MSDVNQKTKVGVLVGGMSAERPISLRSGAAVHQALLSRGYSAVSIDVGRDLPQRLLEEGIEAAFVALHGRFGEDGCVQGLLEVMGIPYTGCGVAASALTMDKVMTKKVLEAAALRTPPWILVDTQKEGFADVLLPFDPPVVVKPVQEGSSVGTTMVDRQEELPQALSDAAPYGRDVLVEKRISGPEVTVAVLSGKALPSVEIRPRNGWYDWHHKYTTGATEYFCPAELPHRMEEELGGMAELAVLATGCEGAVRVDFMMGGGAHPFIIEINTIPGMTETSLLPKAAARAGMSFADLCEEILVSARLKVVAQGR